MADRHSDAEWVIRPYEGVGPIDFNMTAEQVESILGAPLARHTDWAPGLLIHLYGEVPLRVSFDSAGRVSAIEVLDASGVVDDIRLNGRYVDVVQALQEKGYRIDRETGVDDAGSSYQTGTTICDDLGVHLWRADTESDRIDSCGAYQRRAGGGADSESGEARS